MEEELQKRNTDCVYFLASPLTCKKGLDCEYRHNEIARLNPRDCWYWLSGHCLNPNCAFRHPPLEKHCEEPLEPPSLAACQSSIPANKTGIPCYFFFSGFCNKGDRCSFSHGPEDNASSRICTNTSSKTVNVLHLDNNKTFLGNDGFVSTSTETHANPSEMATKVAGGVKLLPKEGLKLPPHKNMLQPKVDLKIPPHKKILQPNEDMKLPPHKNVLQPEQDPKLAPYKNMLPQTPTMQNDVYLCNEAAIPESDSLLLENCHIQARPQISPDQCSDELVDDPFEPKERWESSPGSDVLVDNLLETLVYEDEQGYLLTIDRKNMELNSSYMGYEFQDAVEFEGPSADELLHEGELYRSIDCVGSVDIFGDVGKTSDHSRGRMLDSLLSRKRTFLPMELAINGKQGMDLRERLRKRRVVDGHLISRSSRRNESSRLLGRGQERSRRHGISKCLRRRLASDMRRNAIEQFGFHRSYSNGVNVRRSGWLRHPQPSKARQYQKGKRLALRQFQSSEVAKKSLSGESVSGQPSTAFTGPKTLAQIKEEKKKAEESTSGCVRKTEYSSTKVSANFEGPKPLSEILKDKRRSVLSDCNSN